MLSVRRKTATTFSALAISCAAILGAALPASAAPGTWTATEAAATTVINANTYYYSGVLSAPAGTAGTISRITYSVNTSYPIPAGHYEALCNVTTNVCADTSGMFSGVVTVFNGRPATDKFQFRYINKDRFYQSVNWRLTNKTINVEYT